MKAWFWLSELFIAVHLDFLGEIVVGHCCFLPWLKLKLFGACSSLPCAMLK